MPGKILNSSALALALLAISGTTALSPAPARATCLGIYNSVGDPVACAEHGERLRFDVMPAAATLLGWVSHEARAGEEIPMPFTGIEVESVVKPTRTDIVAAVIAEVEPGVSISANVAYFETEYVAGVQGRLGLGITF